MEESKEMLELEKKNQKLNEKNRKVEEKEAHKKIKAEHKQEEEIRLEPKRKLKREKREKPGESNHQTQRPALEEISRYLNVLFLKPYARGYLDIQLYN